MRLRVTQAGSTPTVSLEETNDFTTFHVVASGLGPNEVPGVLAALGVGRPVDNDVFIDVSALRRLARDVRSPSWDESFDTMVAYARGKGWMSDSGDALRAHIEPD